MDLLLQQKPQFFEYTYVSASLCRFIILSASNFSFLTFIYDMYQDKPNALQTLYQLSLLWGQSL